MCTNDWYVYGHDITMQLSFDEADDMMYAADKYLIDDLMDRLAQRLMSLLTYDNICSLMNNPACYRHLELDKAITRILQYDTGKVLQSNLFPELSLNAFLKILEQESVSAKEVEIWRAALKWATQKRADKEDAGSQSQSLRSTMSPVLQYIRLCTLTGNELLEDVVSADVLDPSEFSKVCKLASRKSNDNTLTRICNSVTPRTETVKCFNVNLSVSRASRTTERKDSLIVITTKAFRIKLSSIPGLNLSSITIVKFPDLKKVPATIGELGGVVFLEPNQSYVIKTSYEYGQEVYSGNDKFENEHFTISFESRQRQLRQIKYSIEIS